jgi:hypothetical protein
VAREVCEARTPVANVAAALGMPPDEVTKALQELLRRGVLSFRTQK